MNKTDKLGLRSCRGVCAVVDKREIFPRLSLPAARSRLHRLAAVCLPDVFTALGIDTTWFGPSTPTFDACLQALHAAFSAGPPGYVALGPETPGRPAPSTEPLRSRVSKHRRPFLRTLLGWQGSFVRKWRAELYDFDWYIDVSPRVGSNATPSFSLSRSTFSNTFRSLGTTRSRFW